MNQTKKTAAAEDIKTKVIEKAEVIEPKKAKSTPWGLAFILIIIGTVLILDSFNIAKFDFNFWSLFKLWPLLLVSAGLGILGSRNQVLKAVATAGNVLLVVFAALVVTGTIKLDNYDVNTRTETKSITASQETNKPAKIEVKSAGKLTINSHDGNDLVKYAGTEVDIKDESSDDTGINKIKIEPKTSFVVGNIDMGVSLRKTTPIELGIDFGAGKVDANLRGLNITKLDINSDASDVTVKLDTTTSQKVEIDFDLGVSNATLYVPKTVGIKLKSDSGMSKIDTNDLVSRGDHKYETPDIDKFSTIYEIELDSGMTNFKLEYL